MGTVFSMKGWLSALWSIKIDSTCFVTLSNWHQVLDNTMLISQHTTLDWHHALYQSLLFYNFVCLFNQPSVGRFSRFIYDRLGCRTFRFYHQWWWWSHSVVADSCGPMDCSPPGSSVRGILQARMLEARILCHPPGDIHHPGIKPASVSCNFCIAGWFFIPESPRKPPNMWTHRYMAIWFLT